VLLGAALIQASGRLLSGAALIQASGRLLLGAALIQGEWEIGVGSRTHPGEWRVFHHTPDWCPCRWWDKLWVGVGKSQEVSYSPRPRLDTVQVCAESGHWLLQYLRGD